MSVQSPLDMSATTGMNGSTSQSISGQALSTGKVQDDLLQLNLEMKNLKYGNEYAGFHGDKLIGDKVAPKGFIAGLENSVEDVRRILSFKNLPAIGKVASGLLAGHGVDMKAGAGLVAALSNDSNSRQKLIESQVKSKYDKMLHPPLTYLGDAFQYRQADGKFNNVLNPHLGQAGAPYAKTVPSKTHPLGALPDPGDLFDRLMARQESGRNSQSGLSAMLIYHATLIIHDIFRTNDKDKNISDSSSYLDLSPLYGYTMEMQKKVRDDKYKLGLLKPDTFAEDRLLRQPPGVCIMLVMYNRYHNYAATQLRRINENGRFSVPGKYQGTQLEAVARRFANDSTSADFVDACKRYNDAWKEYQAKEPPLDADKVQLATALREIDLDRHLDSSAKEQKRKAARTEAEERAEATAESFKNSAESRRLQECERVLEDYIAQGKPHKEADRKAFEAGYDAAWNKLDDDLFNTARLITCGLYVQVSVHDYLRALMGFHQYNTNFTLDPRMDIDHRSVSRGIGNQVTVEFNLLYRFHCAISQKDEKYTEDFMSEKMGFKDPKDIPLETFINTMRVVGQLQEAHKVEPWEITFGLEHKEELNFQRNPITGLFDDQQMMNALTAAMDDPISNFGPRNIPKCLKPVEILGIMQARKWEVGTLNDFRDFFGMSRHETFESVTSNLEIQNALRDLYEHPDKIELYPGVFCESDKNMGLDPGPSDVDAALWAAIFSDAITLVRSDRFYTVDWNTNSLTSWGMKEVTENNDVCKSSVFHRLLQRAFPGWFPYNSIRFFHPFYTSQQNARFAKEQGYAADFRMSMDPVGIDVETENPIFDVAASTPAKPWKPVYLTQADRISAILKDETADFLHPALKELANFPEQMQEVFEQGSRTKKPKAANPADRVHEDAGAMVDYFTEIMRYIVKRESITMNNTTYQIDATRDFAIPVTTRYVADFLGFGHLVNSEKNSKAPHSENEIYQHITNCQVFLSYNADETKLLKRRKAFKSSMEFLYNLTLDGNISEASRSMISQQLWGRKRDNPMAELGFQVAQHVLKHERSTTKAAAILVFVGLHTAYNSVLAFTSVLNHFLKEMYDQANSQTPSSARPTWLRIQDLAFSQDQASFEELTKLVSDAERTSIRLPVIRTALKDREFRDKEGQVWTVKKGDTIILDIYRANVEAMKSAKAAGKPSHDTSTGLPSLSHTSSITEAFADYDAKHLAATSVTSMIKTIAQMKNPRRGHDAQGRLKRVNIDASAEGYSNFMAPMRMTRISRQVDMIKENTDDIYTDKILRPATDTFLTAEWDEMVPFPNTWKIRFDGFGKSDYSSPDDKPFGILHHPQIDPDALAAPPFYQPQGASHFGGSFADADAAATAAAASVPAQGTPKDANANSNANGNVNGNVNGTGVGVGVGAAGASSSPDSTKPKMPADLEPSITTGCGIGK
ncbi:hypothetical protein LTR46_000738 [Exophiala xenobiotica]|nr:hypothetical protein LTR46_000738 [Exophiala xenobiotica]